MKTLFRSFIVVFFVSNTPLWAQNPGFKGKTLLFDYESKFSPAIRSYWIDETQNSMLTLYQSIGITKVVSRKRAYSLSLSLMNNHYHEHSWDYFRGSFISTIPRYDREQYYQLILNSPSEHLNSRILEFGVSQKNFIKNYTAPFGTFYQYGASLVYTKTHYYNAELKENFQLQGDYDLGGVGIKISFAYMHNHIVNDWLIIDYGYELGFDASGLISLIAFAAQSKRAFTDKRLLTNEALVRNFYTSIINFKLGFSVMP
jgi:hypothetical protein